MIHLEELYLMLDKRRRRLRLSWRKLAAEIGVTPSVFTRLSQEKMLSVPNYIRLVEWVENDQTQETEDEIKRLKKQLHDYSRKMIDAADEIILLKARIKESE